MVREAHGVVVTGRDRRQQTVAVFFRDCSAADSADWLKAKLVEYPADRRNVSMTLRHLPCEFSVALFSSSPVLVD
jgi:hypothetical protein